MVGFRGPSRGAGYSGGEGACDGGCDEGRLHHAAPGGVGRRAVREVVSAVSRLPCRTLLRLQTDEHQTCGHRRAPHFGCNGRATTLSLRSNVHTTEMRATEAFESMGPNTLERELAEIDGLGKPAEGRPGSRNCARCLAA